MPDIDIDAVLERLTKAHRPRPAPSSTTQSAANDPFTQPGPSFRSSSSYGGGYGYASSFGDYGAGGTPFDDMGLGFSDSMTGYDFDIDDTSYASGVWRDGEFHAQGEGDNLSSFFPFTDAGSEMPAPSSPMSFKFEAFHNQREEDGERPQSTFSSPHQPRHTIPSTPSRPKNHAQQPDAKDARERETRRTTPESAYEFADDDRWLGAALAQVNKVEAEKLPTETHPSASPSVPMPVTRVSAQFAQVSESAPRPAAQAPPPSSVPQPPGPSRSPYFQNSVTVSGQNGAASGHISSPVPVASRPSSTAAVFFPKVPTPRPASAAPRPISVVNATLDPTNRISVQALDTPEERTVFRFSHFNPMQSAIFQAAYNEEDNLVVTAPTGSGKTTVFELALLHMLKGKFGTQQPLAIYMAPTKALVGERARDWESRLGNLPDFRCLEVTGDLDITPIYKSFNTVDLIVTTPEKFESLTRKSHEFLHRLRLVMIDEVHILHEDRGPTLEVVVSRLKAKSMVRFVAVSASVPNMEDVARWIGPRSQTPPEEGYASVDEMPKARVFKFGDEFRPVPLEKEIHSVDAPNEFALGSRLDKDLFVILTRHSKGKPVLIFCPTRKACAMSAAAVSKDYEAALQLKKKLPWDPMRNQELRLNDSKIQAFTKNGIAVHHAGLDYKDRREIEEAFKTGRLHCLVSTSTLAVGVNLPAHLVVIKGTSMWQGSGFRDYSDVDIQQMMGRAGRPQFDTSGTVVLMCNSNKRARFESILSARMHLESCLHLHLTEHINSEIGLGTITSLESGKRWLRGSFLWIRIQQNPRRYISALVKDHSKTWLETLDRYVENAIKDLKRFELVEGMDPEDVGLDPNMITSDSQTPNGHEVGLRPTTLGKIMSQNVLSYQTMGHIVQMDPKSGVSDLLELLAGAYEFNSLRIRQGEGATLNKLRAHEDIRFKVQENVKTYADKVFLHLQAAFANINLDQFSTKTENSSHLQTQVTIFNAAPRIAKAILGVAFEKGYGVAVRSALELLHAVNGKAWEDSATIFRQIRNIGPKSISVLAGNNITSFEQFLRLDSGRIEHWFNRRPPFGYDALKATSEFPRFTLEFEEVTVETSEGGHPRIGLDVTLSWTGRLDQPEPRNTAKKGRPYNLTVAFISSTTNRVFDVRRMPTNRLHPKDKRRQQFDEPLVLPLEATLLEPDETIIGIVGVDERAGLSNTFEYKPSIDPSLFPKPELLPPQTDTAATNEAGEIKEANGSVKTQSKEPLFDNQSAVSIDEVVDLTDSPAKIKVERRSEDPIDLTMDLDTEERRKKSRKSIKSGRSDKHKRRKVCAFIDDEAEESEDDEEEEDEYDSLAEFDHLFVEDTPSPKPVARIPKPKVKVSFAPPAPAPRRTAPTPVAGKLRGTFFKRTPSAEKPPTADGSSSGLNSLRPSFHLSPLDTTLAPDPHSLGSSRPDTTLMSPSPELLTFSTDFSMTKAAEPTPPSGQRDDFDEWMDGLLNSDS